MTEDSQRSRVTAIALLAVVIASAAVAGCTGPAPDSSGGRNTMDYFLDAYCDGIDHHMTGQDYFNNGTSAWESFEFRQAISDYANASMEYDAAASSYAIMAGYAGSPQEKEFAESLRGCAVNLSLASDDFMNAAIGLGKNDSDDAKDKFNEGQSHVDSSDLMLERCIRLTPEWMMNLSSG